MKEFNLRYIWTWLLFCFLMAVVIGVVTYPNFFYGFKWGGFWMLVIFIGWTLWLFVITPIICPEINVKK